MSQNTEENREKLAEAVVMSWDLDTLVQHSIEKVVELYKGNDDKFQEDWVAEFGINS